MDAFILEKTAFQSFIGEIARDHSVYLPTIQKGILGFNLYNGDATALEEGLTRHPLKQFLLPNGDIIFHYHGDSHGSEENRFSPASDDRNIVVLGVKPCDARSVGLNAMALLSDSSNPYQDSGFQQRQQNLIVIGLGCLSPCADGFCSSVGGSPADETGMDLIFFDLGDSFQVKVLTEKGARLTPVKQLQPAAEADIKRLSDLVDTGRKTFAATDDPKINYAEDDINILFNLPLWEELAERCLNCGICTHLCPTCYCFDLLDHGNEKQGYRFRVLDSCMYQLFTQHASGYNPRKSKASRIRQRFMHKLRYYPENFDRQVACVGCGRCVRYCPVNIDIREVASQIRLHRGGNHD
ncbi:MAG: 4Fe-4S dicluster domain-containing protein [bacterium]